MFSCSLSDACVMVFVADLSAYDEPSEGGKTNRLAAAIEQFAEVALHHRCVVAAQWIKLTLWLFLADIGYAKLSQTRYGCVLAQTRSVLQQASPRAFQLPFPCGNSAVFSSRPLIIVSVFCVRSLLAIPTTMASAFIF